MFKAPAETCDALAGSTCLDGRYEHGGYEHHQYRPQQPYTRPKAGMTMIWQGRIPQGYCCLAWHGNGVAAVAMLLHGCPGHLPMASTSSKKMRQAFLLRAI
jgi:hypothetical protein